MQPGNALWRKSTFSDQTEACIEVSYPTTLTVGIRDSKNPAGGHLTVPDTALHHLTRTLS